jgi:hypothetical protein
MPCTEVHLLRYLCRPISSSCFRVAIVAPITLLIQLIVNTINGTEKYLSRQIYIMKTRQEGSQVYFILGFFPAINADPCRVLASAFFLSKRHHWLGSARYLTRYQVSVNPLQFSRFHHHELWGTNLCRRIYLQSKIIHNTTRDSKCPSARVWGHGVLHVAPRFVRILFLRCRTGSFETVESLWSVHPWFIPARPSPHQQ